MSVAKRKFRILRIWYYGKLPYAKRVKKWIMCQLIRDLGLFTKIYMPKYIEKYGNEQYAEAMGKLTNKN